MNASLVFALFWRMVQHKIISTKLYFDFMPYTNNLVKCLSCHNQEIFLHVIQDHYNDPGVILQYLVTTILQPF